MADALQKGALAFREGAVGGGDEQHQIAAGDEALGDDLVLANDGVGAGRIDNADVREELHRKRVNHLIRVERGSFLGRPVTKDVDLSRGGGDPLFQERLPEEGVDESALSGVEFPHDDEEKEFVELLDGSTQRLPVFIGRAELKHDGSQIVQELALCLEKFFLSLVEHVHVSLLSRLPGSCFGDSLLQFRMRPQTGEFCGS